VGGLTWIFYQVQIKSVWLKQDGNKLREMLNVLSVNHIKRLQLAQNAAAQLVPGRPHCPSLSLFTGCQFASTLPTSWQC